MEVSDDLVEPIDPHAPPDDLDDVTGDDHMPINEDDADMDEDEDDFEDDDADEDIQSYARVPGVPGSEPGDLRAVRHEVK